MIDGNKRDEQNNHRQWQSKVILHKPHPICIGLTWCRKKSNGTGLSSHDAQQNNEPCHGITALKVGM